VADAQTIRRESQTFGANKIYPAPTNYLLMGTVAISGIS